MAKSDTIQRVRRRRLLIVALVLVCIGGAASGLYAWRIHHIRAQIASLKPQGLAHLDAAEYADAMHDLGTYLKHHPSDLDALIGYAEARENVYAAEGRHITQAIGVRRRVLELDPSHEPSRRKLMELYLLVGYNTEAIGMADELLAKHANDPDAINAKAEARWRLREYAAAFEAADQYNVLKPDELQGHLRTLAIMQADGRPAAAIGERAREVAGTWSDAAKSALLIGYGHHVAGEIDQAVQQYRLAAAERPKDADIVRNLAQFMDSVGLSAEATALLQEAGADGRDPRLARLLFRRLWEQGRLDQIVERAGILDATDGPRPDTEALAVLALAAQETGDGETADRVVAELDRRSGDGLARVWAPLLRALRAEPFDAARLASATESALVHDPDHPYFHLFRAEALARQGRLEQAIQAWQLAGRLAPTWPTPLLRIARGFLATNRPTLALEVAHAAAVRSPRNVDAAVTFLEAVAANVAHLEDPQVEALAGAADQVVAAVPASRPRLLPLLIEVAARRADPVAAATLLREGLASEPPLAVSTLMQLASVSDRHDLGLAEDCFRAAAAAWGSSPELALAEAHWIARDASPEEALRRFDAAAESAEPSPDAARDWMLARARLLDAIDPAAATAAWRQVLADHEQDARVLRGALESPAVWRDRALAQVVTAGLEATAGRQSEGWRIARAKLLMLDERAGDRELAEASALLLEITRQSPYLAEPQILLGRCFERMGNHERSLEFMTHAQRLTPGSLAIAIDRARLLQLLGQEQEAGAILSAVERRGEMTPQQKLQVAALAAQRGDRRTAEEALIEVLRAEPQNRLAKRLMVDVLLQQQRFDEAEVRVKELLVAPDLAAVEAAVATYEAQGRLDDAERALTELYEIEAPLDAKAGLTAAFYERRGRLTEAVEVLRSAVGPEAQPQAWQHLMALQLKVGDVAGAIATAERGAIALPEDTPVAPVLEHRELLAAVAQHESLLPLTPHLLEGGDHGAAMAEALRLLLEADGEQRPVAQLAVEMRQLADRHPRFLPVQALMIRLYQSMNRSNDAAEVALRTARSSPDNAEASRLAADTLSAAGRWAEVRSFAEDWKRLAPQQALAADLLIAEVEMRQGNAEGALAGLRTQKNAAHSEEAEFLVHRAQARAMLQNGQTDEARELLQPRLRESAAYRTLYGQLAVLATPDAEVAALWLADLEPAIPMSELKELLALAQAWRALDERFKLDTHTPAAVRLLSQLADRSDAPAGVSQTLGMIHEAEGRMAEAEAAYRRALTIDRTMALSLNNLAMMLLHRGERDEALALARRAVEASPRVAAFQDTLATTLLATGDANGAVEAARLAVSLDPRRIEMYLTLGEALAAAGRADEARKIIEWLDGQVLPNRELPQDLNARIEAFRRTIGTPTSRAGDRGLAPAA